MLELNSLNGAGAITAQIAKDLLVQKSGHLYGCEMGIAWGGGIEKIAKIWGSRGTIWGFDTFEGHPVDLWEKCPDSARTGGRESKAAVCMQPYYEQFAGQPYSYDYIREGLDAQGLSNAKLVKGLITEDTDISFIPHLDYVLLDMDFPVSMKNGYRLVKNKIVSGGYLCLHDVVPDGHIPGLFEFYQEILKEGTYDIISENQNASLLAVLRKR